MATGVGFSSRTDRDGNRFSYLLGWLEQCPRFGPCDPAPERLTQFTFSVTHDPSDVVLCPGVRSSGADNTHCEILGVRSPSYSSFAIVSNPGWMAEPLATAAGVSVVVYDTPSGSLHESLDRIAVAEFLEWVTALLGPYPYGDEFRFRAFHFTRDELRVTLGRRRVSQKGRHVNVRLQIAPTPHASLAVAAGAYRGRHRRARAILANMKNLRPCAQCGSKDAFIIDEALIPNYEYANSVESLTLTAAYAETGEVGLLGAKHARFRVRVEAKICAECGHTELYSKDLDVLARFARQKLGNVRRVTTE